MMKKMKQLELDLFARDGEITIVRNKLYKLNDTNMELSNKLAQGVLLQRKDELEETKKFQLESEKLRTELKFKEQEIASLRNLAARSAPSTYPLAKVPEKPSPPSRFPTASSFHQSTVAKVKSVVSVGVEVNLDAEKEQATTASAHLNFYVATESITEKLLHLAITESVAHTFDSRIHLKNECEELSKNILLHGAMKENLQVQINLLAINLTKYSIDDIVCDCRSIILVLNQLRVLALSSELVLIMMVQSKGIFHLLRRHICIKTNFCVHFQK
jgi:hypothetical protein